MNVVTGILVVVYIIAGIFAGIEMYRILEHNWFLWSVYGWILLGIVLLEIVFSKSLRCVKAKSTLEEELKTKDKKLETINKELERLKVEKEKKDVTDENTIDVSTIDGDDEATYFKNVLSILSDKLKIVQGIVFRRDGDIFKVLATYAYYYEDEEEIDFKEGEGINGQVVVDKKLLILPDIPKGYAKVYSGLGESYPNHIGLWPIVVGGETKYLIEFATFEKIDEAKLGVLKKLEEIIIKKEF